MSQPTPTTVKGYKVTDSQMQCRGFQYELNKEYQHTGKIEHCRSGFHFCIKPADCFQYYKFEKENRVFEVEGYGEVLTEGDKTVSSKIIFLRELTWHEVLEVVNSGSGNTGLRNSGDWNSGDRNSGYRNSGYRNSGDSNSGNWNSGDSNSGNWNSGDRNSGDSNSGYRNSGAFCTDKNPMVWLFDQPTNIPVRDWENHPAVNLMNRIDTTIWVPSSIMTDQEKEAHPKWETTEGYLKTIPIHDAWKNFWHNLDEENKQVFLTLPNFDAKKFKTITGITIKDDKGAKAK